MSPSDNEAQWCRRAQVALWVGSLPFVILVAVRACGVVGAMEVLHEAAPLCFALMGGIQLACAFAARSRDVRWRSAAWGTLWIGIAAYSRLY